MIVQCGGCSAPLWLSAANACWLCFGPLCFECMQKNDGHCGHAVVQELRKMRRRGEPIDAVVREVRKGLWH